MFHEHRGRTEVVHRDVEETLDLGGVEVHAQDPISAGRRDEVGDHLRGDRDPSLVLAILPVSK